MSPEAAPLSRRVRYVCHGCGFEAPLDEPLPFRCPNAPGAGVDHLLRRRLDVPATHAALDVDTVLRRGEPRPFLKFAELSYSFETAQAHGMSRSDYGELVEELDEAVRRIDGRGFASTPWGSADELALACGLGVGELWVKDETRNVSGSHKARHLMGLMLWLELQRRLGRIERQPLGISSCGNAALAAAVVAGACGWPLRVFVPPDARPSVVERLQSLGATLTVCSRSAGDAPGDPCYLRFIEATAGGTLPFTVQGTENGLAIEGGSTLGWEIVAGLVESDATLDHLIIQVGGGGLAAATFGAFREAQALGLLDRLPRLHTVQTEAVYPLRRAHERLLSKLPDEGKAGGVPAVLPASDSTSSPGWSDGLDWKAEGDRALRVRDGLEASRLQRMLDDAARHRDEYMWPWETPPESIAYGILDDETYDWLAVLEGLLETGGIPLVVSEERLAHAHRLANETTDSRPEPTGSAGLAGFLALVDSGVVQSGERCAVLLTGVER